MTSVWLCGHARMGGTSWVCIGVEFRYQSISEVGLWRCFLLPRLVMGGNGAGWPSESESKKHKGG